MVKGVTKNKRVGFVATDFTVSTGAHKREIQAMDPEIQVFGQGCPKFVPLIEGEKFGTPELASAVQEYADDLKAHDVDTVLLACTHYPFVREELQKALGSQVTILDPAERTTQDAIEDLAARGLAQTEGIGETEICFTADVERGQRLAQRVMDTNGCVFKLIQL